MSGAASLKYKSQKTDPNIRVWGSDENYLVTSGYKIAEGRNFTIDEINLGQPVIIIGSEVKEKLLEKNQFLVRKSQLDLKSLK